jgi:hypothetical protein
LFIGFGKNITNNVFDQNRLYFALGYKVNPKCKMEVGYLNLIIQHGKLDPISKKSVYEFNHCFQIGLTYNFDFTAKKKEEVKP